MLNIFFLLTGESWAAATTSPWLAPPPGASDYRGGKTSVCPSPSHGWVKHTHTHTHIQKQTHHLPTVPSMTVTSEVCRLCSQCLLPCQWWKCVCCSSPVSDSLLDLDTSCSGSWPLSLSSCSGLDLPPVKAVTIVKTMLHNWTVTKISIELENSAGFLRRPFRMCLKD